MNCISHATQFSADVGSLICEHHRIDQCCYGLRPVQGELHSESEVWIVWFQGFQGSQKGPALAGPAAASCPS